MPSGAVSPAWAANAPTVVGLSPESDTHVHALRTEVVERLGRVFAQVLLQDHNRCYFAGVRQLIVHDSRIRADERDDAGSATREATHPLQQS